MRTLSRRLLHLEQREHGARAAEVKLFYDEDVTACHLHADCSIEKATGEHHSGVLKLTFAQVRP